MQSRLAQLAGLFLKLGVIGFGGPAAHIATMEEEVVERRRWMSRDHFLDLVGATNLIPGPNSTEMAIHIGYHRAGLAGVLTAGVCFITPAVLITGIIAWAYKQYGQIPQVEDLLYGIKPAVLTIIATAGWRLGRKALKTRLLLLVGLAVAAVSLAGVSEIACLLVGSLLGLLLLAMRSDGPAAAALIGALFTGLRGAEASTAARAAPIAMVSTGATLATATAGGTLWSLGFFFLKVGCVLYGGGYVLIAYLRGELVGRYGFTEQQLLDAIAIGQLTPGPILSTATFVGYQIADWPGALVATLAIFAPSFFLVMLVNPLIPRLRRYRITSLALDSVNAASIGLLIAVTIKLAAQLLLHWEFPQWISREVTGTPAVSIDWRDWVIVATAGAAVWRLKPSPVWLVLGGACVGWLLRQVGG